MSRGKLLNRVSRKVDKPTTKVPVVDTYAVGSKLLDEVLKEMERLEKGVTQKRRFHIDMPFFRAWNRLRSFLSRAKRKHSKRRGGR